MSSYEIISGKFKDLKFNYIGESLSELINRAEGNEVSYLEFAEMMANEEISQRENRRQKNNLKRALLPSMKRLEEFDFKFQTTITKKQISSLLDFRFIDNRENIVFIGAPGVGKTHLAISLSIKAIESGYKVYFSTIQNLIEEIDIAEAQNNLKQKINSLLKNDIIVIDELGYLPMNKKSMYNFFQLINEAYEHRSMIITTNKDFSNWGEFFHEDNVAVPIVDRIIHHSHIYMIGGESYRLKEKTKK